jgi:hypothetical protein
LERQGICLQTHAGEILLELGEIHPSRVDV